MMKAVIPILREIVSHADDEKAPPERHPGKNVFQAGQRQRQKFKPEVGDERAQNQERKSKAGNVGEFFVAGPTVAVIKSE